MKGIIAVTTIVFVCACSKQAPASGGQSNTDSTASEVTLAVSPQSISEQATEALPELANQVEELEAVNVAESLIQTVSVPSPVATVPQTQVTPTETLAKTSETPRQEPTTATPKQEPDAVPVQTAPVPQPSEPPERAIMAYENGNELYHAGLMEEAINMYSTAIQLHPNYPDALHNRGLIYYYSGYHNRALTDFNAALRLKPNHADYLYSRGCVYLGLYQSSRDKGDLDKAIADWEAVIRIEPDHEVNDMLELARMLRNN
jgi:tetratricopeptide (TPR) repeat protein